MSRGTKYISLSELKVGMEIQGYKRDRFVLDKGELIFTLFYPTDTTLNALRY